MNRVARPNKSTIVRAEITHSVRRALLEVGGKVAPFETAGLLLDWFTKTHRANQRAERLGEMLVLADAFEIDHDGRKVRGHTLRPDGGPPNELATGPHVLLVHGWDGASHQLLPFVQPLLARGFVVSLVDLPAHGASEGERTHLRDLADAVARVARELGPLEAVIAHSVGGAAVTIALLEGLDVGRVAFVAPPTSLEAQARAFGAAVGATDASLAPMLATLRGWLGRPIDEPSLLEAVRALRTPLLVVHDEGDRITSHEGSRKLVGSWPGARLVSTRGLGHARILRDPTVVATIVEFVDAATADAIAA